MLSKSIILYELYDPNGHTNKTMFVKCILYGLTRL